MKIFLTGATGFIGSSLTQELLASGHEVIGLTRSDAGAEALKKMGAQVHFGTLEEPEGLKPAASGADAVIHCAFDHNFANFQANCQKDTRVIAALGEALEGTDRPLVITSGTGIGSLSPGEMALESVYQPQNPNPRVATEMASTALCERGLNVSVVRLPQVHDTRRQGLISPLLEIAKEKGVSAYVGEGLNRWPAAHLSDVVVLYRLAVERAQPGSRYHAVAESGIPACDIAEVLGRGLGIPAVSLTPDQAAEHFGWMGLFVGLDMPASSRWTQETLGWKPTGPGLLTDLEAMLGCVR